MIVNAEDVIVTLSNEGYIKRTSLLSFTRSGGEWEGSGVKEGDYIRHVFEVNTLDRLLLFTQRGNISRCRFICCPNSNGRITARRS